MATFGPAISILSFGGWHKTGHRSMKFVTHRRAAIPHYDPEMRNGGDCSPPPTFVPAAPNSEVHDVADKEALKPDVVVEDGAIRDAGRSYADCTGEEVVTGLRLIHPEIFGED